jgi:hypothetical protein
MAFSASTSAWTAASSPEASASSNRAARGSGLAGCSRAHAVKAWRAAAGSFWPAASSPRAFQSDGRWPSGTRSSAPVSVARASLTWSRASRMFERIRA